MSAPLELDQEPGAPHPRETFSFTGHGGAEATLAEAFASGRMHHAWLLTGPKGVGKATLAHRFARVALGAQRNGARPFDVDATDPIARRIMAHAHGDLFVLRRGLNERGRPRGEIVIEDARGLVNFFTLKSSEGGWRIAIVDAVDDLNRNAANAILKTLEEPPTRTVLMLISHAPGGLLATIRSRCRRLDLRPLPEADVRLAVATANPEARDEAAIRFADGRPGRAIALAAAGVGPLYAALTSALDAAPRHGARAFLPEVFKGGDRAQRLALFLALTRDWIRRAVAADAGVETPHPSDAALMGTLAGPARRTRWADAYGALLALEHELDGLDMDPTHAFARVVRVLERAAA